MLVGWKYLRYQKLSNKSSYTLAAPNNNKDCYAKLHIGIHLTQKNCMQNTSPVLILSMLPLLWDNTSLIPQLRTENPTILLGDDECNKTKCNTVEKLILTTTSKITTFHSRAESIQIDFNYPLINQKCTIFLCSIMFCKFLSLRQAIQ